MLSEYEEHLEVSSSSMNTLFSTQWFSSIHKTFPVRNNCNVFIQQLGGFIFFKYVRGEYNLRTSSINDIGGLHDDLRCHNEWKTIQVSNLLISIHHWEVQNWWNTVTRASICFTCEDLKQDTGDQYLIMSQPFLQRTKNWHFCLLPWKNWKLP